MNQLDWRGLEIFHFQDGLVERLEHCMNLSFESSYTVSCYCNGVRRTSCWKTILAVINFMNTVLGFAIVEASNHSVVAKVHVALGAITAVREADAGLGGRATTILTW